MFALCLFLQFAARLLDGLFFFLLLETGVSVLLLAASNTSPRLGGSY